MFDYRLELDLIEEAAAERGMQLDGEEFRALAEQRIRGRTRVDGSGTEEDLGLKSRRN